jgi:hypothetical protein
MEAQELVETQQENTSGSFVPFSAFWLMWQTNAKRRQKNQGQNWMRTKKLQRKCHRPHKADYPLLSKQEPTEPFSWSVKWMIWKQCCRLLKRIETVYSKILIIRVGKYCYFGAWFESNQGPFTQGGSESRSFIQKATRKVPNFC